jgi:hypothetical protein
LPAPLQNGLQGIKKRVGAADDGRAAIEHEPPAAIEPLEALLDNPHRERSAKVAPGAPIVICEIGHVRDNNVGGTFYPC